MCVYWQLVFKENNHTNWHQKLPTMTDACFMLECEAPTACLPAESVCRWRQCAQCVVQAVCGLLLIVLFLVLRSAVEKSHIITYKELRWNSVLKLWKVSTAATVCTFHTIFKKIFDVFWLLSHCWWTVLCQPTCQPTSIWWMHTSSLSSYLQMRF